MDTYRAHRRGQETSRWNLLVWVLFAFVLIDVHVQFIKNADRPFIVVATTALAMSMHLLAWVSLLAAQRYGRYRETPHINAVMCPLVHVPLALLRLVEAAFGEWPRIVASVVIALPFVLEVSRFVKNCEPLPGTKHLIVAWQYATMLFSMYQMVVLFFVLA